MRAREVARRTCVRVGPFAPVHRLERVIERDRFVVVEDEGGFIGVVTSTDLIRRPRRLIVDCVIEKPFVAADQTLEDVLATMEDTGEPFLAVFDGPEFDGVVSYRSVVEALAAERAANAAQRAMTSGLAHDISNAMMAVMGELTTAQDHTSDPQLDGYLSNAQQAVEHAMELARQLGEISRGSGLVRERVSLGAIVEPWSRLAARSTHIELQLNIGDELFVSGVERQLAQVFFNLVLNAGQATGRGGQVRVSLHEVTSTDGVSYVEALIEDDGPGIPAEIRARIEEPYFTTRPTGSGLGLAVVRSIVEEHGGMLAFESSSTGTCVHVRLPAA